MTRPDPSNEQVAAARQVCPCWSDGRTGSPACIVDDGVSCELHSAIADAFAEREAGLRAEVERLTRERDEAHGWLRKVDGQPFPDSVAHCAAFALGSWKGATARAESAESELARLRPVAEAAKAWHNANMNECKSDVHDNYDCVCGHEHDCPAAVAERALVAALARAESAEKGEGE